MKKIVIYVNWEEQDIVTAEDIPYWLEQKVKEVLADKNRCNSYKLDFLDEEDENLTFHDFLIRCFKSRLQYDFQRIELEV